MLGYLAAGVVGYFIGVILTCILLAKRNLETYQKLSNKTETSLKNNIALAKGAYKAYIKEYEEGSNGSDNASDEEDEYETPDDIYFDEHNEARDEQETEEDLAEGDNEDEKSN